MLIIGFWVALALIVGWAANQRGRSGPAWFLIALFTLPIAVVALALAPVVGPPKKDDYRTYVREPVYVEPEAPVLPKPDYAQVIGNLADLRDRGAITEAEFVAKRDELFARI